MTPEQIILLGLIASAITFILRVLATYGNIHLSRVTVNVVLFLTSAGLSLTWAHVAFPPWPAWTGDVPLFVTAIWDYINALVALGAPIMGSAVLIYNFLYEKVVTPLWARLSK